MPWKAWLFCAFVACVHVPGALSFKSLSSSGVSGLMPALRNRLSQSGRSPALRTARTLSMGEGDADRKRWQDLAEKLADPFVSPFEKPAIARELAAMSSDIAQSVQDVASGKVAPEDELLGSQGKKQLRGARFVARQLREDILPSASEEGQKIISGLQSGSGSSVSLEEAAGQVQRQLMKQVDDLTADGTVPKFPTPDEILVEVRNAVQGSDEGLETPDYTVVSSYGDWEIRDYPPMVVSTVTMRNDGSRLEQGGNAFNTLAGFLFGDNSRAEAMAMTTPVITTVGPDGDSTDMSFVMPSKYDVGSLPQPKSSSDISLSEQPPATVAAIQFPGFATKEEVVRQRERLVQGLQDKGWVFEGGEMQVTVLQYNAPYTLPTVRRNEVVIKLDRSWKGPSDTAAGYANAEADTGPAAIVVPPAGDKTETAKDTASTASVETAEPAVEAADTAADTAETADTAKEAEPQWEDAVAEEQPAVKAEEEEEVKAEEEEVKAEEEEVKEADKEEEDVIVMEEAKVEEEGKKSEKKKRGRKKKQ